MSTEQKKPPARLTEASNEITTDIDVASPEGMMRLLRQVDSQLFNGYLVHPGVFDAEWLRVSEKIAEKLSQTIQSSHSVVVLSGCGTSGRLAFFCARAFNTWLSANGLRPCFRYLVAGGDVALVKSQEAVEDDPAQGAAALKEIMTANPQAESFLYFGITCGLSAPYVAGQLEVCLSDPRCVPVLFGFNPTEAARNAPIEKYPHTFFGIVQQLLPAVQQGRAFIWNPAVGPEGITGSTRMKGGSATKFLLETVFVRAALLLSSPSGPSIAAIMESFERSARAAYLASPQTAALIQLAGDTLKAGGCISYLGHDGVGLLGFIDASEQPPTYGAKFTDVRGFMPDGWGSFHNIRGDLSHSGPAYRISFQQFIEDVQPNLGPDDLVVFLADASSLPPAFDEHVTRIADGLKAKGVKLASITTQLMGSTPILGSIPASVAVRIHLPFAAELLPNTHFLCEFSVKLTLNAVSTGAHVLKGQVYRNTMINLRLSNNKLFFRALDLLRKLTGVDEPTARSCLLRSIYLNHGETVPNDSEKRSIFDASVPVSVHIAHATERDRVVPLAILLASSPSLTAAAAQTALLSEPVLRIAMDRHLQKH